VCKSCSVANARARRKKCAPSLSPWAQRQQCAGLGDGATPLCGQRYHGSRDLSQCNGQKPTHGTVFAKTAKRDWEELASGPSLEHPQATGRAACSFAVHGNGQKPTLKPAGNREKRYV